MTVASQTQTVSFSQEQAFSDVEALVKDIKAGKMVVLIDDESRENEGDVVIAAEHVTQKKSEGYDFLAFNFDVFFMGLSIREFLKKI